VWMYIHMYMGPPFTIIPSHFSPPLLPRLSADVFRAAADLYSGLPVGIMGRFDFVPLTRPSLPSLSPLLTRIGVLEDQRLLSILPPPSVSTLRLSRQSSAASVFLSSLFPSRPFSLSPFSLFIRPCAICPGVKDPYFRSPRQLDAALRFCAPAPPRPSFIFSSDYPLFTAANSVVIGLSSAPPTGPLFIPLSPLRGRGLRITSSSILFSTTLSLPCLLYILLHPLRLPVLSLCLPAPSPSLPYSRGLWGCRYSEARFFPAVLFPSFYSPRAPLFSVLSYFFGGPLSGCPVLSLPSPFPFVLCSGNPVVPPALPFLRAPLPL